MRQITKKWMTSVEPEEQNLSVLFVLEERLATITCRNSVGSREEMLHKGSRDKEQMCPDWRSSAWGSCRWTHRKENIMQKVIYVTFPVWLKVEIKTGETVNCLSSPGHL